MSDAPNSASENLLAIARTMRRQAFVSAYPGYFLLALEALTKPQHRGTMTFLASDLQRRLERAAAGGPAPVAATPDPLVLPVKKVQSAFDSMITIGRTANNDLVLEDAQISRVHAVVRLAEGRVELSDAGSRHGTFAGEVRLEPKGPAVEISTGVVLRFAALRFLFLDAAALWERAQLRR